MAVYCAIPWLHCRSLGDQNCLTPPWRAGAALPHPWSASCNCGPAESPTPCNQLDLDQDCWTATARAEWSPVVLFNETQCTLPHLYFSTLTTDPNDSCGTSIIVQWLLIVQLGRKLNESWLKPAKMVRQLHCVVTLDYIESVLQVNTYLFVIPSLSSSPL